MFFSLAHTCKDSPENPIKIPLGFQIGISREQFTGNNLPMWTNLQSHIKIDESHFRKFSFQYVH